MNADLLDQLRLRASDPGIATDDSERTGAVAKPPLAHHLLLEVESALGFSLPESLRQAYLQVGNGGFGPAYGLLGIHGGGARDEDGCTADQLYEEFRKPTEDDPHWSWPERLLPVGHLGCGVFMCVDCSTADGRLVWFEPNPHEPGESWEDSFIPMNLTLVGWLERWLEGTADAVLEDALAPSSEMD